MQESGRNSEGGHYHQQYYHHHPQVDTQPRRERAPAPAAPGQASPPSSLPATMSHSHATSYYYNNSTGIGTANATGNPGSGSFHPYPSSSSYFTTTSSSSFSQGGYGRPTMGQQTSQLDQHIGQSPQPPVQVQPMALQPPQHPQQRHPQQAHQKLANPPPVPAQTLSAGQKLKRALAGRRGTKKATVNSDIEYVSTSAHPATVTSSANATSPGTATIPSATSSSTTTTPSSSTPISSLTFPATSSTSTTSTTPATSTASSPVSVTSSPSPSFPHPYRRPTNSHSTRSKSAKQLTLNFASTTLGALTGKKSPSAASSSFTHPFTNANTVAIPFNDNDNANFVGEFGNGNGHVAAVPPIPMMPTSPPPQYTSDPEPMAMSMSPTSPGSPPPPLPPKPVRTKGSEGEMSADGSPSASGGASGVGGGGENLDLREGGNVSGNGDGKMESESESGEGTDKTAESSQQAQKELEDARVEEDAREKEKRDLQRGSVMQTTPAMGPALAFLRQGGVGVGDMIEEDAAVPTAAVTSSGDVVGQNGSTRPLQITKSQRRGRGREGSVESESGEESMAKEKEKEDWRKSDATMRTVRLGSRPTSSTPPSASSTTPSATSTGTAQQQQSLNVANMNSRTPTRPLSVAESSHSGHTVVPGSGIGGSSGAGRRLSAMIGEFLVLEGVGDSEDDDDGDTDVDGDGDGGGAESEAESVSASSLSSSARTDESGESLSTSVSSASVGGNGSGLGLGAPGRLGGKEMMMMMTGQQGQESREGEGQIYPRSTHPNRRSMSLSHNVPSSFFDISSPTASSQNARMLSSDQKTPTQLYHSGHPYSPPKSYTPPPQPQSQSQAYSPLARASTRVDTSSPESSPKASLSGGGGGGLRARLGAAWGRASSSQVSLSTASSGSHGRDAAGMSQNQNHSQTAFPQMGSLQAPQQQGYRTLAPPPAHPSSGAGSGQGNAGTGSGPGTGWTRQTKISMTSTLAPAAGIAMGFGKRAAEKLGRALGGGGHGGGSSNSSLAASAASSTSSSPVDSRGVPPPSSFLQSAANKLARVTSNADSGGGGGAYISATSSSGGGMDVNNGNRGLPSDEKPAARERDGWGRVKKSKHRGTQGGTSGTWSLGSSSTSPSGNGNGTASASDSDAPNSRSRASPGPNLGTQLRGPLGGVGPTGVAASGYVFGRELSECVRETKAVVPEGKRRRRSGSTASFGMDMEVVGAKALEERWLPAIVLRCAQHLEKWGVQEEGLFRIPGRLVHVNRLRAEFDSGADYDMSESGPGELDAHAVASVFKAYLRELPEPILTRPLLPYFDAAMSAESSAVASADAAANPNGAPRAMKGPGLPSGPRGSPAPLRKPPSLSTFALPTLSTRLPSSTLLNTLSVLIARLPPENRDLLRTVTELIRVTAKNSKETKMPMSNLLLVFCPSLSMSPPLLRVLCEGEGIWNGPPKGVPVDDPVVVDIKREDSEEVLDISPRGNGVGGELQASQELAIDHAKEERDEEMIRQEKRIKRESVGLGMLNAGPRPRPIMHPEQRDEQQVPSPVSIANDEQRIKLEKRIKRESFGLGALTMSPRSRGSIKRISGPIGAIGMSREGSSGTESSSRLGSTSETEFVDAQSREDLLTSPSDGLSPRAQQGSQNPRSSPTPLIISPEATSPLLPGLTLQSESSPRNTKRQTMYGTLPNHFSSLGSAPVTPIGTTMNANLTVSTYSSSSPDLAQLPQPSPERMKKPSLPMLFRKHSITSLFSRAQSQTSPPPLTPESQQSTQSSVSSVPPVLDVALDSSAFGIELGDVNEESDAIRASTQKIRSYEQRKDDPVSRSPSDLTTRVPGSPPITDSSRVSSHSSDKAATVFYTPDSRHRLLDLKPSQASFQSSKSSYSLLGLDVHGRDSSEADWANSVLMAADAGGQADRRAPHASSPQI
ncbi:RhoGAP-domain-containing protein [Rickenella mellea]|uniref:RhoGAP-domain-containing protein n=1 Tax=Rickenella mellea TaxID=50990 RepID=A0A4Y7QB84_9AGAM|nr:RhoGAP-domain-containing protein [Rickenella mellea]